MPKNNQRKRSSKPLTKETKAEKRLRKRKGDFEGGKLDINEIRKFPIEAQDLYLRQELGKKYKIPQESINFKCIHCALYVLSGGRVISDDDLLSSIPGLHKQ